jgi:predicted negative regulator of RcsB-dependent stress response
MNKLNRSGFSAVEVVLVVVVVGLIGFAGWKVYDNGQKPSSSNQQASTQQQDPIPAVNSASDLQASEDYLNAQDLDKELDTAEIDSALAE